MLCGFGQYLPSWPCPHLGGEVSGGITQLSIAAALPDPGGRHFPVPVLAPRALRGAPCGCRTAARPHRGSRHQGRGAGAPGREGQIGGKFSVAYFVPSHLARPVSGTTTLCHLQDLSWGRSRHARLLEAKPPRNRDRCSPFFHVLMLKLHFKVHKMTNMPSYLLELVIFFLLKMASWKPPYMQELFTPDESMREPSGLRYRQV